MVPFKLRDLGTLIVVFKNGEIGIAAVNRFFFLRENGVFRGDDGRQLHY